MNRNGLTHCTPNNILEDSNLDFRNVRLCHSDILRRLIWVCTVCQLPFLGSPDYNGIKPLSNISAHRSKAVPLLQFLFVRQWFYIWHLFCHCHSFVPLIFFCVFFFLLVPWEG